MKMIEAVRAHQALLELKNKELNYEFAVAVLRAIRETSVVAEVFGKGEAKLVEKYAKRDEKGDILWTDNRTFSFANIADSENYNKEKNALSETEVLSDFKPILVNHPAMISPAILEAITCMIAFKE